MKTVLSVRPEGAATAAPPPALAPGAGGRCEELVAFQEFVGVDANRIVDHETWGLLMCVVFSNGLVEVS